MLKKCTFSTRACVVKNKELKKLSDYIKQNGVEGCRFDSSESWVILSEIEQRIKAKIEAVGTPLKDWDINIYRGILTGYNEAFIIDKVKKEEILANCQTDEERQKTAEIIRPILRGRDIKHYGYEFADLYLINTHNGVKEKGIKRINIEDYPAVKAHLDLFYPQLEKRADQGDTPYNLRNCAYIEDFSKQKIVYPETTQGAYFALDINEVMLDKTCFMIITDHSKFLIALLSSKLYEFAYKSIFSSVELGISAYQYNKHALVKLPIIKPTQEIEQKITTLLNESKYQKIDQLLYKLYNLSEEEINYINSL